MRYSLILASAAALTLLTGCNMKKDSPPPVDTAEAPAVSVEAAPTARPAPPIAPMQDKIIEQVGRTRNDPYNWLKDENWQEVMKDPSVLRSDIRAYLEEENAYTKAWLEDTTTNLREELFKEMRGRIKEDDSALPDIDGAYAYLTRYRTGGEYAIFARKPAADIYTADVEGDILLDGDVLGKDKSFFSFGAVGHSPDHKLMGYAYDDQGSEIYDIRFRDIATGKDLPDVITGTAGDFTWSEKFRRGLLG